jgi:hypothetical protein
MGLLLAGVLLLPKITGGKPPHKKSLAGGSKAFFMG